MNDYSVIEKEDINTQPVSSTDLIINALLADGVDRFDPIKFHFIEAMARKSAQQQASVKSILDKKIVQALADYQLRFEAAKVEASTLVTCIKTQCVTAAQTAQHFFDEKNFVAVKKIFVNLKEINHFDSIAELTCALQQEDLSESDHNLKNINPDSLPFYEVLRKQENEAFKSHGTRITNFNSGSPHSFGELKAMRLFRATWTKLSTDKRAAKTIENAPENAGPLNSARLIIQSLTTMRDISPEYLNRFMAFTDTLLWLEQAGKNAESSEDKLVVKKVKPKR